MTVKWDRQVVLSFVAGLVAIGALALALLLPQYGCRPGWHLVRDIPPPAGSPNGWLCVSEDVGYLPDSRLPLKYAIGIGGFLVAGVLVLLAHLIAGARNGKPGELSL